MGTSLSSSPLGLDLLKEINSFFGFEEKLQTGSPDIVNDYIEVSTGTGASSVVQGSVILSTGATSGSVISLENIRAFPIGGSVIGTLSNNPFTKFSMEWTGNFMDDTTNIDDTKTFMGLIKNSGSDRSTQGIAGFALNASKQLIALTDAAGTEEITLLDTIPLNNTLHLYRIDRTGSGFEFYIDKVLVATHITTIPAGLSFLILHNVNDAAVSTRYKWSSLRAWFQ